MARFPVIVFIGAAAAGLVHAQSDGSVQPGTAPTPAAVQKVAEYSESQPRPRRRPAQPQPVQNLPAAASNFNGSTLQREKRMTAAADGEVFTVDTNLVTIPVSVFDRNGLYIPNLKQSDFTIFEDGREQEIEYFGTTDKPFTVVLLLDTSPSTEYKIEEIIQAATAFVSQLKAQDKVMVIEFDGNIHVLTEITADRQRIYKAIKKADFGYGTSLYDAVDVSLRKHLRKVPGRKAIVLFTDGVDTTSSKAGYDTTLALAEEADALVFPIYYNTLSFNVNSGDPALPVGRLLTPAGTRPEDYALGKQYLDELADHTGGRVFQPEAVPGGLTKAFEGIAEELRRQYNIGYVPAETGVHGQRKQIRVRVSKPNLVLRARDSYIVGASKK